MARGRPKLPKSEAKRATLSVRLTADERQLLDEIAKKADKSPSEWGRAIVTKALKKTKR